MLNSKLNFKKTIVWALGTVAAVLALVWLHNYLTFGKITVKTTDSSASVEIKQIVEPGSHILNPYTQTAAHELSVKLKRGRYQVLTFNKTSSISQFVNLGGHQKLTLTLNPPKTLPATPVYGGGATGLITDDSQLLFVDLSSNTLSRIDGQNNLTELSGIRLSSVKWANKSLGAALGLDNLLYGIKGGRLSKVNLPFTPSQNAFLDYDIAKDGTLYVSHGKDVYSGKLEGPFKKIYSSDGARLLIYAGADRLAIIESEEGKNEGSLVLVNNSGKIAEKDLDADRVVWSPDGKYLIASGDSGNIVLDSSLTKIADVNINNATRFTWKDDEDFYYAIGNQLWDYDLSANLAKNIATMPSGLPGDGTIGEVFPTSSNYVYISAQRVGLDGNNNAYQLYRINLKGGAVADDVQTLSILLPENEQGYSLSYVNFTAPTILVRPHGDSNVPVQKDLQDAQTVLQQDGFNLNRFNIKLVAPTGS